MSTFYHTNGNNNLNQSDLQKLSDSWITTELAEQAGLFRVDKHEGAAIVGRNGSGDYSGIVFPYYWPGETRPREYRLRLDNPDFEYKSDGTRKEKNKYLSPPGGSNKLYIPPGTDPSYLTDTSIPILITEGEKKALALYRLGIENGKRWLVIGLSGVWNWRGVIGKEEGPNGERRDVKGPIADLERVSWRREQVLIIFDANVHSNTSVKAARRELTHELIRRGAKVFYANIPADVGINGVDDLLALWPTKQVLELLAQAQPSEGDLVRFNRTDAGNAEVFAYLYGDRVRYDHARERWLVWRDHWWGDDSDGQLKRYAIEAARQRFKQSINIVDLDERKRMATWAIASESRSKIEATLALAKVMHPITDAGKGWDSDPWLLGVGNGVVDLRTGILRPGWPDDRITSHTTIPYDPNAQCPCWLQSLQDIFGADADLIDFVWRGVGYSLTGRTSEQVLFICHGGGNNGKSKFFIALCHILGTYAYDAPFSTFEIDQRATIPNDVAALEGRRLVVSSETNAGIRLNEARVKALTGCDAITARFLHREFFTFNPVCKIWLGVNHLPKVRDDSHGFWRRVRLIPFKREFTEAECDQNIEEKFKAEAAGILAWAIRGCLEWQRRGLKPVAAVTQATEEYRIESDILGAFFEECCVIAQNAKVEANNIYKAYCNWAEQNELKERERMTANAFGRRMRQRFEKKHSMRGWFYYGVGLRTE